MSKNKQVFQKHETVIHTCNAGEDASPKELITKIKKIINSSGMVKDKWHEYMFAAIQSILLILISLI